MTLIKGGESWKVLLQIHFIDGMMPSVSQGGRLEDRVAKVAERQQHWILCAPPWAYGFISRLVVR